MRESIHGWAIQIPGPAKAVLKGVVPVIASIFLGTNLVGSADAEVRSVAPNGFEVVDSVMIQAPPERVYAALGEIGQWWDSAHTFSKDAANLRLELKAGGCFCERLKDGGSVQHLLVVYASPEQGLRLRGALGPLQMEGVDGTLAWALKPNERGTNVTRATSSEVISVGAWRPGRLGSIRCCMSSWTTCSASLKRTRRIKKRLCRFR